MDLWDKNQDWEYYGFDLNEPLNEFPEFASIHALWDSKRKDGVLPKWSDFEFTEFRGWHGFLMLADVLENPFDLRYRLFGTQITEAYQRDFTGKTLRGMNYEIESEADLKHFEKLHQQRRKGITTGPLHWKNQEYFTLSFCDLPLYNEKGEISQFLTAMARDITKKHN